MEIWSSVEQASLRAQKLSDCGVRIICVPTMGNLHDGHRSLVMTARDMANDVRDPQSMGLMSGTRHGGAQRSRGFVIVTHFVNRRQFNDQRDFKTYPRTFDDDISMLESWGVDAVFAPEEDNFFPSGHATQIRVTADLTRCLCALTRPGHFDSVALVVTKLLQAVRADDALFGLKDFQQWRVICRVVHDLNLPVCLLGVPTVRDCSGVALSSRLTRLSQEGRQRVETIYPCLCVGRDAYLQNRINVQSILTDIQNLLARHVDDPEYLEFRYADTLEKVECTGKHGVRLFVAATIAGVRVIDNISVNDR